MSRGIKKWSEDTIARLQKQGRGKGRLATYDAGAHIRVFYSEGRTHGPFSHLARRNHHFLLDGEYRTSVFLECNLADSDIREQYPLKGDFTLEIASQTRRFVTRSHNSDLSGGPK